MTCRHTGGSSASGRLFCRRRWIYLAIVVACCLLFAYPAWVYSDLAGMGGYDGFASPAMMREHGAWRDEAGHTSIYRIFLAMYLVWLLSLANLPVAVVLSVRRIAHCRHRAPST